MEPVIETSAGAPPADPEGKAAELLAAPEPVKRGRGRPRKDGKPSGGAKAGPASPEIDQGPPTEAEIRAMATLGGIVWALVAVRLGNLEPLAQDEVRELGTAMVPVFRKYASALGGFEAEFTLLVVVGGLVMSHLPPPESDSEVIELDDRGRPIKR